jgi:hypothetical protein
MQAIMSTRQPASDSARYARCVEVSKRIRWDIDRDVIRGRHFNPAHQFLPDGLSLLDRMDFLQDGERLLLSQIQGRTYANMFGLVERFIGAKMLELSRGHWLGDQSALTAVVGLVEEELKHQELFRRIEILAAENMPEGYRFLPQPNEVAAFVLGKSTWSILALTCHIELFSQAHYRESIHAAENLSPLFSDVFLFHWKEESQHAIIDELEWKREDSMMDDASKDAAVDDLIALVAGVDGLLQAQAQADTDYFLQIAGPASGAAMHAGRIGKGMLAAYRWQYILSGLAEPRFAELLARMTTGQQVERMQAALAPLVQ